MINYVLPAAVAALALGTVAAAPGVAQAQMAPPTQLAPPANISNVNNANATIVGQPQPGPTDYADPGFAQPMPNPYGQPMPGPYVQPISPRTTWIPGHYNWDPTTSNYVYTDGQYVEAPTATAQWIPGHWVQTPSSWIWINGTWK